MAIPWGPIISGGASILGGLLGGDDDDRIDPNSAVINKYNWDRKYARNNMSWLVEGAKRAGIHPLYALGVSQNSSPVLTGGSDGNPVGSLLDNLGDVGANIADSVVASREAEEQKRIRDEAAKRQEAEHAQRLAESRARVAELETRAKVDLMDHELRVAEAARRNQALNATGVGRGDVKTVPDVVTSASKDNPGLTAGTHPGYKMVYVPGFGPMKIAAGMGDLEEILGGLAVEYTGAVRNKFGDGYEAIAKAKNAAKRALTRALDRE